MPTIRGKKWNLGIADLLYIIRKEYCNNLEFEYALFNQATNSGKHKESNQAKG